MADEGTDSGRSSVFDRVEGLSAVPEGGRGDLQRRAEEFVRGNRFTIAVIFPVVGAAALVASAEGLLVEPLRFNPILLLVGVAVMRLPLLVGVAPAVGRRAGTFLAAAALFAYGIEAVGIATGKPYGEFAYGVALGPMLAGVPVALPLLYLPLVLNAVLLVLLLLGPVAERSVVRLPATLAVVLAVDFVLDPGAVALGFWTYADAGVYYGVPPSNFAGWALSGAVTVALLDRGFPRMALRERLGTCEFLLDDLVSFVLLWGTINLAYGNWLAVAVAGAFLVALLRSGRFDFDVARTAPVPRSR